METWESCVSPSQSVSCPTWIPTCLNKASPGEPVFWRSLLSFLGGRLLAMTWISFIVTDRRWQHSAMAVTATGAEITGVKIGFAWLRDGFIKNEKLQWQTVLHFIETILWPLNRLEPGKQTKWRHMMQMRTRPVVGWSLSRSSIFQPTTELRRRDPVVSLTLFHWLTVGGSNASTNVAMPQQRQWRRGLLA